MVVQYMSQQGLACRLLRGSMKAAKAGQTKGPGSPAPREQTPRKRAKDSAITAGSWRKGEG